MHVRQGMQVDKIFVILAPMKRALQTFVFVHCSPFVTNSQFTQFLHMLSKEDAWNRFWMSCLLPLYLGFWSWKTVTYLKSFFLMKYWTDLPYHSNVIVLCGPKQGLLLEQDVLSFQYPILLGKIIFWKELTPFKSLCVVCDPSSSLICEINEQCVGLWSVCEWEGTWSVLLDSNYSLKDLRYVCILCFLHVLEAFSCQWCGFFLFPLKLTLKIF